MHFLSFYKKHFVNVVPLSFRIYLQAAFFSGWCLVANAQVFKNTLDPESFLVETTSGLVPLAVGDLDGDGKPDLILHQRNTTSIQVRLHRDAPNASLSYAVTGIPSSIHIADFNGDQQPDLAIRGFSSSSNSSFSILLNTGGGTFSSATSYPVGNLPQHLTTGDLNHDGFPDIVVCNAGTFNTGSSLSVYLNNQSGKFYLYTTLPIDGMAQSAAILNNSQYYMGDIAVTNPYKGSVEFYTYNHANSFRLMESFYLGGGIEKIIACDLNQDHRVDLVVSNNFSNSISTLLYNGYLFDIQTYAVGYWPSALAAKDLNGDGQLEVVVTHPLSHFVSVLTNQGSGRLSPAKEYTSLGTPNQLSLDDWNGDGHTDILIPSPESQALAILLNKQGSGEFGHSSQLEATGYPRAIAAGDLNGDGLLDMALCVSSIYEEKVVVYLNAGQEKFRPPFTFPVGTKPIGITLGDFNMDGHLDIATVNETDRNVSVLLNQGNDTFTRTSWTLPVGSLPTAIQSADLNNDSRPDLAVTSAGTNQLSVFYNNGSDFDARVDYAVGAQPSSLTVEDFNNDGRLDMAVTNTGSNTISVLLNQGHRTFDISTPSLPLRPGPKAMTSGDFNGDSYQDLYVVNSSDNSVILLTNTGNGSFEYVRGYGANAPTTVVSADFNKDRIADLAVIQSNKQAIMLYQSRSNELATSASGIAGQDLTAMTTGDFNGDGKVDIAVTVGSSSSIAILYNYTPLADAPLPVRLLTLKALPKTSGIQIEWVTAAEENSRYFEVQRSLNRQEFTVVGQVPAKGYSLSKAYYELMDLNPVQEVTYYRLKTVDQNGHFEYSKTIAVKSVASDPYLRVANNPSNARQIQLWSMGYQQFTLRSLLGQSIDIRLIRQADGSILLTPQQALSPGVYLIEGRINDQYEQIKVVIL